jgi:protein phosphatase
MDAPERSMPGGLITPIEPSVAAQAARAAAGSAQHAVQSTPFSRIEVAVASARGTHHVDNEDAHSDLDGPGGLFVVADGVGGGAMAQLASRLLVDALHGALESRRVDAEAVRAAMLDADRAIQRAIACRTDLPGAATVVLGAPVDAFAARWLIGWVGDCRAYRLAADGAGGVEALTRDDTFRALGEAAPPGGSPDDPARMVGNGAISGANVALHELAAGDLLALCSDGVHRHLGDDDWRAALRADTPLPARCERLIAAARAHGSTDDATVLLLRRIGFAMRRPRWIARFGGRDNEGGTFR